MFNSKFDKLLKCYLFFIEVQPASSTLYATFDYNTTGPETKRLYHYKTQTRIDGYGTHGYSKIKMKAIVINSIHTGTC